MNHTSASTAGWVSSPNERGTMDIIWSSFLTIFLCTWTAICLNLPHPKDGGLKIFCRKTKWMFWAIVCPELVLAVAIGQYASARRSVIRFRKLGAREEQWTLRHGFFADMGGIILCPKESTPFVVNSRQLVYLVEKNYLNCPDITDEEIWDKSKTDTISRIITALQAFWFVMQLVGRAILKLPISTLELFTGAIVFCSFGIFICWFQKPCDVQKGIMISTEVTTAQILIEAGDAAAIPYRDTPLDFVAKQSFTISYDVMRSFGLRFDDPERPLRRFPDDRFPDISTLGKFALFCMTSAFASFHLIGWSFMFPSHAELILWRSSSLIVTGATFLYWIFETIAARQRYGRWDKYLIYMKLKKPPSKSATDTEKAVRRQDTIGRLDAFEKEQMEAKPILHWEIGLIIPIVLLYVVGRAYMMVEVFVGLRALPLGVYQTFSVENVLPHW